MKTTGKERLAHVVATYSMDEYARFTYCVEHHLHPAQIDHWRKAFEAFDPANPAVTQPNGSAGAISPAPPASESTGTQYITADDLAIRLHYDVRTVRDRLVGRMFVEGIHYFRLNGGRKLLFDWPRIEADLRNKDLRGGAGRTAITGAAPPAREGAR